MPYCPHCGNEVEQLPAEAAAAAIIASDEVEIARINAERDVEVARIQASAVRSELETAEAITETEAEAAVEVAAAEAEIIGEIIAEGGAEAEPDPLIIQAPEAAAEISGEPDSAPPERDETEQSEPAESRRRIGLGAW